LDRQVEILGLYTEVEEKAFQQQMVVDVLRSEKLELNLRLLAVEEEGRMPILVVMEEDQLVKHRRMEMIEMELHQQVDQLLIALVVLEVHIFMRSGMEVMEHNFMAAIVVILMVEEEDLVTMEVVVVPHSFSQELVVQVIQED
jgi:hypothetical protein